MHSAGYGKRIFYGAVLPLLAAAAALLAFRLYDIWIGDNLHEVVPGRVYRCAQLDTAGFERIIRAHGIRTVINLRGECPRFEWYHEEVQALAALGVNTVDVNFSYWALPSVAEVRKLVEVLETGEGPFLMHCRRGSDRTGLGAAIAVLVCTEGGLEAARGQLSLRYGHVPVTGRRELSRFFDLYEEWLAGRRQAHHRDRFREWITTHYQPYHLAAEVMPLEVPKALPVGRPVLARFRVTNQSRLPWKFRTSPRAGVHLRFRLKHTWDEEFIYEGGGGFFDRTLAPGESIDLPITLPAVRVPGVYTLLVDMKDEKLGWFRSYGSAAFEKELEVVVQQPTDMD